MEPIRNVIFLDVDGVLNRLDKRGDNVVTLQAPGMKGAAIVDLNVAAALEHVLRKTQWIKLVVSSTWRFSAPEHGYVVESVSDFARYVRLDEGLFHEDWRTDLFDTGENRVLEVEDWLRRHREVTRSATIEDNFVEQFKELPACRHVHVDWREGLTFKKLEKLMLHFGVRVMPDLSIRSAGGPIPPA